MINRYYKIIFNIRTNGKSVYAYIKCKKTTPKFTCIIYDYDTILKQYIKIRAITSGESPIIIATYLKNQIHNIYRVDYNNIEVKEIDNKLFNFVINSIK